MPGLRKTVEEAISAAIQKYDTYQSIQVMSRREESAGKKPSTTVLPKNVNTLIVAYAVDLELRKNSATIQKNLKKYLTILVEIRDNMVKYNLGSPAFIEKIKILVQRVDNLTDSKIPSIQDYLNTLVSDYEQLCIAMGQTKGVYLMQPSCVDAMFFLDKDNKVMDIDVIELMIKNNADVTSVNSCGYTTLMQAVGLGNLKLVTLLLERKDLDINVKNQSGFNVLTMTSHFNSEVQVEIFQALLSRGAEIENRLWKFLRNESRYTENAKTMLEILTKWVKQNVSSPKKLKNN